MGRIYITFCEHPEAFPMGDIFSLKKARPSFRASSALSRLVCSAGTYDIVGKIASWLHPRPDIYWRMAGTTGRSDKRAQTGELEGVDGSGDWQQHDPKPGNRAWLRAHCHPAETEQQACISRGKLQAALVDVIYTYNTGDAFGKCWLLCAAHE